MKKKPFKHFLLLISILVFSICAFSVYWLNHPVLGGNPQAAPKVFAIEPGSGVRKISQQIADAGIDIHPNLFWLLARLSGSSEQIQAGSYEVTADLTPWGLLQKMVTGQVIKSSLTIIEGWTFKQMRAAIDADDDVKHDTKGLTDAELLAKIPSQFTNPEGLFLPNTYLFAKGTSDLHIYRQAYNLMQMELNKAWAGKASGLPYKTSYDALTMASIVEKETGHQIDRDKVAGVFVNRLRIGMRLQTDPTVIYGMGETYQGLIRKKDLTTDTIYNTYMRAGLPPTPIALPGLASIHAALHPADTKDLYFVSKGDGTSHFSTNLREHNDAVNRYIRSK